MFEIDIDNIEPYIFLFNGIAHAIYIFLYLMFNKQINEFLCKKIFNKKYILNILYILGHLFIIFAMVIRINKPGRKSFEVVNLGGMGYFFLFLSILLSCIFKQMSFNFDKILFLILQLSMIYVYALEYIINNDETIKFYNEILIVIPLILSIYYYFSHYLQLNNAFSYGNMLVAIVYTFLLFITIMKLIKREYITVF